MSDNDVRPPRLLELPLRIIGFLWRLCSFNPREREQALFRLRTACLGLDLSLVTTAELGITEQQGGMHVYSGGPELETVLNSLEIQPTDSILDIGCGKGGALMTFAKYPFARVDGFDISPQLIDIARRNLARMNMSNASLSVADAAEFSGFDAYSHLYFYNPVPPPVMKRVMDEVRESLRRHPRRLTLIYMNPESGDLVLHAGFRVSKDFQLKHRTIVYSAP